jgi:hypothetical protein
MEKEKTKKLLKSKSKSKSLKYNETSFKAWGSPHGVTGNTDPFDPKSDFSHDMFYRMGLSRNGAHFELFQEIHHTDEDIKNAKKWLRINQDVLSIVVVKEVV